MVRFSSIVAVPPVNAPPTRVAVAVNRVSPANVAIAYVTGPPGGTFGSSKYKLSRHA